MRTRTLVALLIVAGAVVMARRLVRPAAPARRVDEGSPPVLPLQPPTMQPGMRRGSAADRGLGDTIAMDLQRARAHRVEPVVEFLTYVQSRRGETSHLMFVRMDDLDAMAEAANEPVDDFLDRLDRLGVVVSHN